MAEETTFRFILEETDDRTGGVPPRDGQRRTPPPQPPGPGSAAAAQMAITAPPRAGDKGGAPQPLPIAAAASPRPQQQDDTPKPPKPPTTTEWIQGGFRAGTFATVGGVAGMGAAAMEVGGLAARATGSAGLMAAAAPVVAVFAGLTLAARQLDNAFQGLVQRASAFSGPVAAAGARNEVNTVLFELEEARRMGPMLARFSEAKNDASIEFHRITNRLLEAILEHVVPIMEFTVALLSWLEENLNLSEWGPAILEVLAPGLKVIGELATLAKEWLGIEEDKKPDHIHNWYMGREHFTAGDYAEMKLPGGGGGGGGAGGIVGQMARMGLFGVGGMMAGHIFEGIGP